MPGTTDFLFTFVFAVIFPIVGWLEIRRLRAAVDDPTGPRDAGSGSPAVDVAHGSAATAS